MKDLYIRKIWEEESICFLIHFEGEYAVRQIEIKGNNKILLSNENPIVENSQLYDQTLSDLDLYEDDFISKGEFENEWLGD